MSDTTATIVTTLAELRLEGALSAEEEQAAIQQAAASPPITPPAESEPDAQGSSSEVETDLRRVIAEANFGTKVKYALLGNSLCRGLLIRDTNKLIPLMVLRNPRITPGEVEEFAKNTNLSDKVLRAIGDNKSFTRSYRVKVHLVSNPRTPGDVALRWLRFLQQNDLRMLARSKNVSQLVATTARKMLQDLEEKGG